MKKVVLTTLMLLIVTGIGLQAQNQEKKKDKKSKKKTEQLTCWASIDCEECKKKVEKNIAFEKGVKDLKVDLNKKLITISYRPDKTTSAKLEKAIQDLGYTTEIIPQKKKEEKRK